MPPRLKLAFAFVACCAILVATARARAQNHRHADSSAAHGKSEDINGALHMEMSPLRSATKADSQKAAGVAVLLRSALGQYKDTVGAVADGYKMFMPQVKEQKVYHFTNNWRALQEAFRFDPEKPTSLLYKKDSAGTFILVGAMYTAPKRFGPDKLDSRVPLSIARWHKHVNWCMPKKGATERWLERRDGMPVFGPESPIATEKACKAVGGNFRETVFGWMLHANVFAGDDPGTIWGDTHAGHDMHAGMKMDGM